MSKGLTATAYHEAGHAVARYCYGLKFKSITIVPTIDYEGCVDTYGLSKRVLDGLRYGSVTPRLRQRVEEEAKAFLAGNLAESLVQKSIPATTWETDRHDAIKLLVSLCGSAEETEDYANRLFTCARDFVTCHEDDIRRLAEALLERRTLTYAGCVAVLE